VNLGSLSHRLSRIEDRVRPVAEPEGGWVGPMTAAMSLAQRRVWDGLVSRTPSLAEGRFDPSELSTADLDQLQRLLVAYLKPADHREEQ